MKKWLCLLLAVLMLVCLCACGEKDDKDNKDEDSTSTTTLADDNGDDDEESPTTTTTTAPRSDAELIVGTWEARMDLSDLYNTMLAASVGEMAEYFTMKDVCLTITQEFKADGTFESRVEKAAIDEFLASIKTVLKNGFIAYLEAIIEGQGVDMTVEELLEQQGTDVDTMVDAAFDGMALDSIGDSFKNAGKYKLEDGKLYSATGLNGDIDETVYETYVITENTLVLTASFGDNALMGGSDLGLEDFIEGLYPITFTRK